MKITKYLSPSEIILELPDTDKPGVIKFLVGLLVQKGKIPKEKVKDVVKALLEREALTSTGLGYGVALPHAKTDAAEEICLAFGRSTKGIDFSALDGNPANFFFLILAPAQKTEDYLKTLSNISALVKDEQTRSRLSAAKSAAEIYSLFDQTR
jgi:mannitol/fructose-specific phosphotransferase system IIA component (Ntr-type)